MLSRGIYLASQSARLSAKSERSPSLRVDLMLLEHLTKMCVRSLLDEPRFMLWYKKQLAENRKQKK